MSNGDDDNEPGLDLESPQADSSTDRKEFDLTTEPPEDLRHLPFEFRGSASEYFGIWIVNLLLSILTLGIYSAWAKVRTKRYFYGNTFVDDTAFEYHAKPMQILIGRLIAVGAYILYSIMTAFAPTIAGLMLLGFIFAVPWVINRSLRFNTRMSSYRNVRLGFGGDYWSAFKTYILWPIAGVLSIGLLIPFAAKVQKSYIANSVLFGGRPMTADFELIDFYGIYLMGILIAIGLAIPITLLAFLPIIPIFIALPIAIIFIGVYIQTRVTNLVFNTMVLDQKHRFNSEMSAYQVLWITISNALVIAFTLGLMYPWTRVRLVKYRASMSSFYAGSDLNEFVSTLEEEDSAIGEEVGEFFDIEIGI